MCSGFIYTLAVFFGLAIGSFLNACIWRLKNKTSILYGRSICPHCKHELSWIDLIPVISFIFLRRRCRYCGKEISWQYPLVELASGILFGLAAMKYSLLGYSDLYFLLRDWFFIGVLIIIFVYDVRWGYILDRVTLPAAIVAFAANILLGAGWQNLIFAAAIGSGFFLFQYAVSRGKWVGGGDIRLGALMGFMLGWPHIITALFFAYFIGAAVAIYLLASRRKKMGSEIAMGTFLSVGTAIALLWGDKIITWYFGG